MLAGGGTFAGEPLVVRVYNAIMIRMIAALVVTAWLVAPAAVRVQGREPIIDVHLHASAADAQGPPPLGMCTPIEPMPSWSQQAPFPDEFIQLFKQPRCADPIWSPATDADLMNQTIAAVRRLNVFGPLSGPASMVDAWVAAEPMRFMPALQLNVAEPNQPSVVVLRERHAQKKLMVIGEVTNQYGGALPDDPRMA